MPSIMYTLAVAAIGMAAASTIPVRSSTVAKRGTGTCSSPEFEPVAVVGSSAGTPFCESNWGSSYLPITNITVFASGVRVRGIQVIYSDGTQSDLYGASGASEKSIGVNYATNVGWDRVSMYSDSNVYVKHLLLESTDGDVLNEGENVASDPYLTRTDQAVGSAILFGVQGTIASDGAIGSLGFLFLASPIETLEVNNVQFPNGPVGTAESITPTDIGTAHFYNNGNPGDPTETYAFMNSFTATQSWAFAQAITNTFTVAEAIQLSFMFTLLADVLSFTSSSTTTFTWTTTTMETTTTTITEATMVGYNAQIPLAPGQGVDCVAVAGQGSGTFPFTSTVTITLKNGNAYSFPESGYLTVNSLSQGNVECSAANHP